MAGPGVRIADEERQGGPVQSAVAGAGEQGERGVAQQLTVGLGAYVRRGTQSVRHRRRPARRSLVVRPAVDRPAHRGRFLLGEDGQELVRT